MVVCTFISSVVVWQLIFTRTCCGGMIIFKSSTGCLIFLTVPSGNPENWHFIIWHYWCLVWGWLALFYLSADCLWLSVSEKLYVKYLQHIYGDLFDMIDQLLFALITLLLLLCLIRAQQSNTLQLSFGSILYNRGAQYWSWSCF